VSPRAPVVYLPIGAPEELVACRDFDEVSVPVLEVDAMLDDVAHSDAKPVHGGVEVPWRR
jgi:hypothetical protein